MTACWQHTVDCRLCCPDPLPSHVACPQANSGDYTVAGLSSRLKAAAASEPGSAPIFTTLVGEWGRSRRRNSSSCCSCAAAAAAIDMSSMPPIASQAWAWTSTPSWWRQSPRSGASTTTPSTHPVSGAADAGSGVAVAAAAIAGGMRVAVGWCGLRCCCLPCPRRPRRIPAAPDRRV